MKKISRRSFLTVVGAAAATAALTACGGSSSSTAASTSSAASTAAPAATASNASVVLKFDLTVSLEHPWGLAATEFKNRIEEKSGGSMTVEIYPASTSGSEADSLAGMLVGTTSMTMSGGSFNGYAPSATLLEAPWAYNSEEDVQAMCESDIGKGIMQDFEDAGFKVLWYQRQCSAQQHVDCRRCHHLCHRTERDLQRTEPGRCGNAGKPLRYDLR